MTGCEIIIKNGTMCLLGKFRHDGGDVEEFVRNNWKSYKQIADLWKAIRYDYLKGSSSDPDDVESKYTRMGYYFKVNEDDKEKKCWDIAYKSLEDDASDDDGYNCSYTDYTVFVDLGKKIFRGTVAQSCAVGKEVPGVTICKRLIASWCKNNAEQVNELFSGNDDVDITFKERNWIKVGQVIHSDKIEKQFSCHPFGGKLKAYIYTDKKQKGVLEMVIQGE